MNNSQTNEQIIKEYQKKADEILKRMYFIVLRAQRKVEDIAYKKIINKLQDH